MGIAALIFWLLTAGGGFFLLGTWIARGGARQPNSTQLPAPVVFGHFALAVTGLIVWIVYLFVDTESLAWVAFVLLIPVALLGFAMLLRWIPTYRARSAGTAGPAGTAGTAGTGGPPEGHFPVAVVAGHGVLAVVTVVLVLLTALGVGGS
ncbi:hypothetical protein LTT66_24450 [Nocardia gipuzkoensis]|uniref:hypothetical protein n=1 Tax=Nocardia gipuzkoensis TaxID=2749991 RepID=UPI001E48E6D7|nr:hypothetical protein [Nocardia gipuzkoensis]UGT66417.1 hypothetical protein LTT66_24450 [Nocardia gipuzkoensis]